MANRRRFLQGSVTGMGAALAAFGINPALAQEIGKAAGRSSKTAEGRVLECRPAGDMVRSRQAGGGILGQAVQRRGNLVRRRIGSAEAARGDRQSGIAEVGFRRHPGLRDRHPHRPGQ